MQQKIIPFIWYESRAEEAVELYTSLLENSKIIRVEKYSKEVAEAAGQTEGSVMQLDFELAGQKFSALNGGPHFKLNPSISFQIICASKKEVDQLWQELSEGGNILMPLDSYFFSEHFGWCEDKFGLSWQVMYLGEEPIKQKIIPAMLFVGEVCGKAEEALNFYTSVFKEDSNFEVLMRYKEGPGPDKGGTVQHAHLRLAGLDFGVVESALDHKFTLGGGVSFLIKCSGQEEVDYFWERLLEGGGKPNMCGWLADRFGVGWQVVPKRLLEMTEAGDAEQLKRVNQAIFKMRKIDINELETAFQGKS